MLYEFRMHIWSFFLISSMIICIYISAKESIKHKNSIYIFFSLLFYAGYLGRHDYANESLNKTKSILSKILFVALVVCWGSLSFITN